MLNTGKEKDNIKLNEENIGEDKIREMGNHQELLARRGMYYNLYNLQYKGV